MISQITLHNVRAYQEARAEISDRISVFFGPNGQGKTTFLEAAFLLATGRSFRTSRLSDLIRTGEESASVEGKISDPEQTREVQLRVGGRAYSHNHKNISNLAEFTKGMKMVALAPEHLGLIAGSAEERRKYLDQVLFALDPSYLSTAQNYRRVLKQKQALLRQKLPTAVFFDQVAPWNQELLKYGKKMREQRLKLTKELAPKVAGHATSLFGVPVSVELNYCQPKTPLEVDLKEQMRAEHFAGRALCGPHRDDLLISLRGVEAQTIASQGERASILLALKLAEIDTLQDGMDEHPILILDDVGATLDEPRRKHLFERLAVQPYPALISTTEKSVLKMAGAAGGRILTRVEEDSVTGFSIARWVAA